MLIMLPPALRTVFFDSEIDHLTLFIGWVMNVPEDLDNQLMEELKHEVGEEKMQYITGWERRARRDGKREGKLEGRQEGRLEGKLEGKRDLFLLLANQRFGTLPDWASTRVNKADPKELDQWSKLLLTDKPLEEILASKSR